MATELQHEAGIAQLELLLMSYQTLGRRIQSLGGIIHDPSLVENGGMSEWLAEVEARREELDVLTTLTTKVLGKSNENGGPLW